MMAKPNRFGKRSKSGTRKPLQGKTRRLHFEALECRRLLSADPLADTLAMLFARRTPDPHPSGDQPLAGDQVFALANYTPAEMPPSLGIAEIEQYCASVQQIHDTIESDPSERPAVWGENVAAGTHQYRLHLDDNGMIISLWRINWGGVPEVSGRNPRRIVRDALLAMSA